MAKKHKHEEHENLERWLVSYADFITLLFAFFVVLYALGQTEKREFRDAIISIQRAFLSGGGIFPLKGQPFTPYERPMDRGSQLPPSPSDVGPNTKSKQSESEWTGEEGAQKVLRKIQGLYDKSTGLSLQPTDLEVVPSKEGFRIRLSDQLIFRQGSDKIKREQIPFLYELGKRLKTIGLELQIEGHNDTSGSESARKGWELSFSRAYNVGQFLIEGTGYPKDKISLASYGDSRPIRSNESSEGRARNRRVEIAVIKDDRRFEDLPW